VSADSERKAALELLVKGAQARGKAQRERNDAKAEARQKKARFEKNLKGPGPQRHVPRGSVRQLEVVWEELMAAYHPGLVTARWFVMEDGKPKGGKEVGLTVKLIQKYSASLVELYFRHVFGNWGSIRERFPKSPVVPTVGWLFVMVETLMAEAQQPKVEVEQHPAVVELMQWFKDHPDQTSPPAELMARVPLSFKKGG